jgi:LPS-assembly protein
LEHSWAISGSEPDKGSNDEAIGEPVDALSIASAGKERSRGSALLRPLLWSLVFAVLWRAEALAQISAEIPAEKYLFERETSRAKQKHKTEVETAIKSEKPAADVLDFKASKIEFRQEANEVAGRGGVIVSSQGALVQADQGVMNTVTKEASLTGNIIFSYPGGSIHADSAKMNLNSETGEFNRAQATIEQGLYDVRANRLLKTSEFDYEMYDAEFSTCHCPDGSYPWSIGCDRADAEQEGYGYARNAHLNVRGVPVFYSPYFMFPVKIERATGLLAPQIGYNKEDGARFSIPLFMVLDGSTDLTFRPFTETKTRSGAALGYRQVFSEESDIQSRVLYSNESARGDDLKGTNTSGLFDPTIDTDRFGGFYQQAWRTGADALLPMAFMADGHYVSDNLFLREIEDGDIGLRDARYTTSRAMLQFLPTDFLYGEISGEYNQALVENPDLTFQRAPELSLTAQKSLRPFGYNPYGIKIVPGVDLTGTEFVRELGYDGQRADVSPRVKVPFHYANYLNGQFSAKMHQTGYSMDNDVFPDDPTQVVTQDSRSVYQLDQSISTAVERVYKLDSESWLTNLASLGRENRGMELKRLKHTIEPTVAYSYVPEEEQDGLPLYDTLDRIRHRSLVTYGVRQVLFGRFIPPKAGAEQISELTPEVSQLPSLETEGVLPEFGIPSQFDGGMRKVNVRQGEIREVATFDLYQSYDMVQAQNNSDPDRNPLSDLGMMLGLAPSKSVVFTFDGNYGTEDREFSSWGLGAHLKDDRGDILRARYTFIDQSIDQIETGVEAVLTERLRLGYYARYDSLASEFIRNSGALRILSACNCWSVDIGFVDTVNPDRQQFLLVFNLGGLGDVAQRLSYGDNGSS